jgi:hypothetical protein
VVREHSFQYQEDNKKKLLFLNFRVICPAQPPGAPARQRSSPALQNGNTRFRVEAIAVEPAGTLVIAVPLTEMKETLGRLLTIEALVTIGVALTAGVRSPSGW